jgi:hypothetical protein
MSKDIEALFLLGHYFAHNRNSTGVTGVYLSFDVTLTIYVAVI